MRAKKGDWFSLNWDLTDYYDPICFEQYDACPRFIYANEDSKQIESEIINKFDRIRLSGIFLTEVFITDEAEISFQLTTGQMNLCLAIDLLMMNG